MKIKDLINEDCTDLVAKYYVDASKSLDDKFNPEAAYNSRRNKEHYTDWNKTGLAPIITKPGKSHQPKYNHNPEGSEVQTPGYRGKQTALKRAGLPYDKHTQAPNLSGMVPVSSNTYDT